MARNPAAPDLQIGELIENAWRIERVIGRGGMGTVFLAADERLGRQVALKTLSSRLPDPDFAERFLREGRVLAAIDHPNVVAIHAVGRHREIPFIVMRYVEGEPLSAVARARGGKLGAEEVLQVVRQLSVALAEVHARGVVHRDLKPANVMVGHDGHVTLFDFGIARPTGSALTRTGIVFGTPGYMAPEVIVGERTMDGRADQYSLAVIVFELLTGFAPFIDANEDQLLMKHLTAERPPVSVAGGIPAAVDAVVARGMAVDPAKRYPDILEFSTALEAAFGVRIDERETLQRAPLQRPLGPDGSPLMDGGEEGTGPDFPIITVEPTPAPAVAAPSASAVPIAGPGARAVAGANPSSARSGSTGAPGGIPIAGPGASPNAVGPARTVARPGTVPAATGAPNAAGPARTVSRPGTIPAAGSAPNTAGPARTVSRPGTIPAAASAPNTASPARTVSRPGTIPAAGDPTPPPHARSLSQPDILPAAGDPTPPPRRSLSQPDILPAAGDPTPPPRRSISRPGTLPAAGDPTPPPRRSISRPGTLPAAGSPLEPTDPATPRASDAEAAAITLDRWVRRHRGKIAAAIAAVILIGVGLSFLLERPTPPPPAQPIPVNLVGIEALKTAPPPTAAETAQVTRDVLQRIEAVEQRSEQARVDRKRRTAAAHPRVRKQIVESGSDSPEGEIQVKVLLDGKKVGAIVTLDGQRLGPSPVFAPARPGSHSVRVQYRPFPESIIPVEVGARRSVMLEVELRPLEDLADGPPPPRTARRRR